MISLYEAKKIRDDIGCSDLTNLIEHEDAYEFYGEDENSEEDDVIIILKKSGKVLSMMQYNFK